MQTGDILLRFHVADRAKPVDFSAGDSSGGFDFPWASLDEVPDMYFERLPRPWPTRKNALTSFLTEVGVGNTVTVVFLRDGLEMQSEIILAFGPMDFTSAPKYSHEEAGLTVKNITYELRSYFQMTDDDPGVVVAEIEPGSKASVAGIKPCEIITAVNTEPVRTERPCRRSGGWWPTTSRRFAVGRHPGRCSARRPSTSACAGRKKKTARATNRGRSQMLDRPGMSSRR